MSRLIVSNQGDLTRIISNRFTTDSRNPHRMLIVIELAPQLWLENYARSAQIKFISTDALADRADQISALLGQEHDILAHSVNEPMDAGLLAALAGTVTHNGVLLLSLPTSPVSPAKGEKFGNSMTSHFGARLSKLLTAAEKDHPVQIVLVRVSEDRANSTPSPITVVQTTNSKHTSHHTTLAAQEQDQLLSQAYCHLTKSGRACISIVGKRGRGKTSLLARIANRIHASSGSYCITALNKTALGSFHQQTNHESTIHFQTPTAIPRRENQVVLVDEAANLPARVLHELLREHDKIVFCTTVEGYENAGRAFQNRFSKQLQEAFESPLFLKPVHPWRWREHDPLEQFIDHLVLNSPAQNESEEQIDREDPPALEAQDVQLIQITQSSLVSSERLLENVYGLLRDTHYQTNVKDLQHLLDGSDIQIWALRLADATDIIAVAVVSIEPSIDSSLHSAIVDKQRRLPHHLLAQLLAQCANNSLPLSKQLARITRISVRENFRRMGLGSKLLNAIEHQLLSSPNSDERVDAIGASFAKDPVSVNFWQSNGYKEFHEGFRKNPRTALPSSAVLRSNNDDMNTVLQTAIDIHDDNQLWRKQFADSSQYQQETLPEQVSDSDLRLLNQFIKGCRSAHDTFAAICRLGIRRNTSLKYDSKLSSRSQEKSIRQQVAAWLTQ
ncbi:MAG: GNAT family N-acetyltransferase [Granulosicoccus sp.]